MERPTISSPLLPTVWITRAGGPMAQQLSYVVALTGSAVVLVGMVSGLILHRLRTPLAAARRSALLAVNGTLGKLADGPTRCYRNVKSQPWVLVATVTTVALAVVAIRALAEGVQLIDERAIAELRARDVFTADHPLVGTESSAGDFNHPGPLQFDLFAVPIRLLGGPVGVTLTVIAVNVAMVWLSGAAARQLRRARPRLDRRCCGHHLVLVDGQ